jgi:hypothetical protein
MLRSADLGVIVDVFVDKTGGLQFLGCMDWDSVLAPHRTVRLIGVNDVHLSMLNTHLAEWALKMLGPRPFFLLSHYLYLGTQPPHTPLTCMAAVASRHLSNALQQWLSACEWEIEQAKTSFSNV